MNSAPSGTAPIQNTAEASFRPTLSMLRARNEQRDQHHDEDEPGESRHQARSYPPMGIIGDAVIGARCPEIKRPHGRRLSPFAR